jgi:large subunit ribosomal protein L9
MKVILLKDVDGIGKKRQVVEVKTGYAANYLLPHSLAVKSTPENLKKHEDELAEIAATEALLKEEAEKIKAKIDGAAVALKAKGGPEGKLYGAVTSQNIADAIHAAVGIKLDKRKIASGPIKEAGQYPVKIKLHPEVEASVTVDVERE